MEEARELLKEGVLSHLDTLEMESLRLAKQQKEAVRQQRRLEELRSTVERLRARRDQLRAKVKTTTSLEQLTALFEQEDDKPNGEKSAEDGHSGRAQLELSMLQARLTHVKHLLHAYHLIGGYDIVETRKGKAVCFSIATAFEGQYLARYNLELQMAHTLRVCRHNIPPFIPLESLAKDSLQTDVRVFLEALGRHLNGFAGRQQQARLVKELLKGSVQVMESNAPHTLLVLLCTDAGSSRTQVLLTLEYGDHTHHLPTRVTVDSEDQTVSDLPGWKEVQRQLGETPVHTVLLTLKEEGRIC